MRRQDFLSSRFDRLGTYWASDVIAPTTIDVYGELQEPYTVYHVARETDWYAISNVPVTGKTLGRWLIQ